MCMMQSTVDFLPSSTVLLSVGATNQSHRLWTLERSRQLHLQLGMHAWNERHT